jgi:hypothetical protein
VVHNYYNLFLYYHIIDTEEMSQRAIKRRINKQIQLYKTEATILEQKGTANVTKYSWEIPSISLDECGTIRVVGRVFPYVVPVTGVKPYRIYIYDIQTTSFHPAIPKEGSTYLPKSALLECEYAFKPMSPIVVELSPQTISKIVLRIDEDGGTDIGINKDADFTIVLQIEEKEPEYIEYGTRNNIQLHQQQPLAAQNYGGNYYGY